MSIDKITSTVSAFTSYDELITAIEGGYTPTLRVSESNDLSYNRKVWKLRNRLIAEGHPVFPPVR